MMASGMVRIRARRVRELDSGRELGDDVGLRAGSVACFVEAACGGLCDLVVPLSRGVRGVSAAVRRLCSGERMEVEILVLRHERDRASPARKATTERY
jgi:hypothetical protein